MPTFSFNDQVIVYHRKRDGSMVPYERSTANAIHQAVLRGQPSLKTGVTEQEVSIDLIRMKHVNCITQEEEEIVIRVPWNPETIASVILQADQSLRHKVLCMVLEKLRQEDHITKIIKSRIAQSAACVLEFVSFRSNPYLSLEHPMYKSFLDSLDKAAQLNEKGLANFLKSRRQQDIGRETDDFLLLGFHGTKHRTMGNILETGMDPTFRKHGADWFSTSPLTSIGYTIIKTGKEKLSEVGKLLVFLLIKEKESSDDRVALLSTANELPIGEAILKLDENFLKDFRFK